MPEKTWAQWKQMKEAECLYQMLSCEIVETHPGVRNGVRAGIRIRNGVGSMWYGVAVL